MAGGGVMWHGPVWNTGDRLPQSAGCRRRADAVIDFLPCTLSL